MCSHHDSDSIETKLICDSYLTSHIAFIVTWWSFLPNDKCKKNFTDLFLWRGDVCKFFQSFVAAENCGVAIEMFLHHIQCCSFRTKQKEPKRFYFKILCLISHPVFCLFTEISWWGELFNVVMWTGRREHNGNGWKAKGKEKQSSWTEHAHWGLCALPMSRMWRHWFIYLWQTRRSFYRRFVCEWKAGKVSHSTVCVWNPRKVQKELFQIIFSSSDAVARLGRSAGRTERSCFFESFFSVRVKKRSFKVLRIKKFSTNSVPKTKAWD